MRRPGPATWPSGGWSWQAKLTMTGETGLESVGFVGMNETILKYKTRKERTKSADSQPTSMIHHQCHNDDLMNI